MDKSAHLQVNLLQVALKKSRKAAANPELPIFLSRSPLRGGDHELHILQYISLDLFISVLLCKREKYFV